MKIKKATRAKTKHVCTWPDSEKPMIFRGKPYCSDKCRKKMYPKK